MTLLERVQKLPFKIPGMGWTSLVDSGKEKLFRYFLEQSAPIKCAVEIGTYFGLATALIAEYAEQVVTIDVMPFGGGFPRQMWNALGVGKKITDVIIKSTPEKQKFLRELDFNFAFVDGAHVAESIQVDWDCVKKCKRVLVHDMNTSWTDVTLFVEQLPKSLDVIVKNPFALVLEK